MQPRSADTLSLSPPVKVRIRLSSQLPPSKLPQMNQDPNGGSLHGRQSRKRPRVQVEDSDSNDQDDYQYRNPWGDGQSDSSRTAQASSSAPLSLPPLRVPGYDYRTPIMSTAGPSRTSPLPSRPPSRVSSQSNVIDLTEDSPPRRSTRPPRFGRNIMSDADVVDLEQESPSLHRELSSPEVQFLGSTRRSDRTLPRPVEQNAQSTRSGLRSHFPPSFANSGFMDIFHQIDPDQHIRQIVQQQSRSLAFLQLFLGERAGDGQGGDLAIDLDDANPVELNYTTTTTPPARREPEYVAPPAAEQGFTRSPKDGDISVCPNCDCELGTGDDPMKRQIWVAKPCGHVYCGQCTKNRALSKGKRQERARNPLATKPFSKCVVTDCEKVVSPPKAMFQLYM